MTHPDPGRPQAVITADAHPGASIHAYQEPPDPVGEPPGIPPERVAGRRDGIPDDSAGPTSPRVRHPRQRGCRS